jgi:hypothetical protein
MMINRKRLAVFGAAVAAVTLVLLIPVPRRWLDELRPAGTTPASPGMQGNNPPDGAAAARPGDPRADKNRVFRDTKWPELLPEDWNPYRQVRKLREGMESMTDDDPRAMEMLKNLREMWNNAPINAALDGAAVRIPGYVVPLDESKGGIREFLLVPYFGACIHTPPPPSNQIIHVLTDRPVEGLHAMDTVWISGTLKADRSDSVMGASSYRMQAALVKPYVEPK